MNIALNVEPIKENIMFKDVTMKFAPFVIILLLHVNANLHFANNKILTFRLIKGGISAKHSPSAATAAKLK